MDPRMAVQGRNPPMHPQPIQHLAVALYRMQGRYGLLGVRYSMAPMQRCSTSLAMHRLYRAHPSRQLQYNTVRRACHDSPWMLLPCMGCMQYNTLIHCMQVTVAPCLPSCMDHPLSLPTNHTTAHLNNNIICMLAHMLVVVLAVAAMGMVLSPPPPPLPH